MSEYLWKWWQHGAVACGDVAVTAVTLKVCSRHMNCMSCPELTCNKSTQLHDASRHFIGLTCQRRDLIGCSETRTVGAQRVMNTSIGMWLFTLHWSSANWSLGYVLWTSPGTVPITTCRCDWLAASPSAGPRQPSVTRLATLVSQSDLRDSQRIVTNEIISLSRLKQTS